MNIYIIYCNEEVAINFARFSINTFICETSETRAIYMCLQFYQITKVSFGKWQSICTFIPFQMKTKYYKNK